MPKVVVEEESQLPARLHLEYIPPVRNAARPADAPQYHGEAAVDIIAVHGLAAKYHRTWSVEQPDGTRYGWLREQLPKDMPDARILGFEYPSNWYRDPVHTSLEECGAQLLRCLTEDRCHPGRPRACPTRRRRPIIFIGHSFGGLVIKQAMILAGQTPASTWTAGTLAMYENHRDLLSSIAGIVFLGTPHRGSGFSVLADMQVAWGTFKSYFTSDARPSAELISILQVDSVMVMYIQSEFKRLCWSDSLSNLSVYCYYEMKPLLPPPHIVVNQDSASIDNAICRGMEANHMEMNKFHGASDTNYKLVLNDLKVIYHQATKSVAGHFEAWKYGSLMQNAGRDRLQRQLRPSRTPQAEQFTKKLGSHKFAPFTCQWIHSLQEYNQWYADSPLENVLWINGKAGSGKSVLAAYIIDHLRSTGADPITCGAKLSDFECMYRETSTSVVYFFCGVDRASETPERMLGTLIHQLLLAHPENERLFQTAAMQFDTSSERYGESPGAEVLATLFLTMASLVDKVYIVVDGLEENKDWSRWVDVLRKLAENIQIRILVSCQATSDISRKLSTTFDTVSEVVITDHSQEDIRQFSKSKTTDLISKKPMLSQKEGFILESLLAGSQGMFQWVNAALSHLEEDVEDPDQVEASFQSIPSELRATWERVFRRSAQKGDPARDQQIRTALQFLAVSGRPVTLLEIKNAIALACLGDSATSAIVDKSKIENHAEIAEREIPSLLGSLIDISDGSKTVQLAHGSLLLALTSPATSESNSAAAKYSFSIEDAHKQLADICMLLCKKSTFVHANAFGQVKAPFVEYAWDYWAYHLHNSTAAGQYGLILKSRFDDMCFAVSGDALAYLDALCQFLSRPLRAVPGRFSDGEYILALQRSQDALVQPIAELAALRKQFRGSPPGVFGKLDKMRKDLPNAAYQIPGANSIIDPINKTSNAISEVVKGYTGKNTTVTRLGLDEVLERSTDLTKPSGASKLMLDVARHLRLLTLRLAVDPVYSALILSAGGRSFSPLHLLIYIAQMFEQSGSFPYWSKHSPHSDLLNSFCCSSEDPEAAPAKFVLHCFEWRERHRGDNTDSLVGRYIRLNRIQVVEPSPNAQQLLRVSTANEEQVRRLHRISGKKYYEAAFAYKIFNPPERHWARLITNPLAGFHMKKALMIEEHEDVLLLASPDEVLPLFAPESVRETPLNQYVMAIPHILRMHFIRWVVALLEVGGRISKEVLATHFARMQVAAFEIGWAVGFFLRFRATDPDLRLRYWYLVPGLLLFWLRCRYMPIFGAYYMPHTWAQFTWAWKHPAAYLDLQNVSGFLLWLGTVLRVMLYNGLGALAIGWSQAEGDASPLGMIANIYGVFHALCTAERSIFGALTTVATIVSCALVMLKDPEALPNMFKLSIFYWFNTFFGLFMGAVQTGALQNGAGVWTLVATSFFQVFMIFIFVWQFDRIIRWVSFILTPITAPCMFLWRVFFQHYILLVQICAVGALLFLCGIAFMWAHKFIWDPYDIDSSLRRLYGASRQAQGSIFATELKRIGQYPLGNADMLRRTLSMKDESEPKHEMTAEEKAQRQRDVAVAELNKLRARPKADAGAQRYVPRSLKSVGRILSFPAGGGSGKDKPE